MTTKSNTTLAARIRARRIELGLTQRQAAARVVPPMESSAWNALEHGRDPRASTLARIAEALETTAVKLLGG